MHLFFIMMIFVLLACQSSSSSKFQNKERGFPEPSFLLKNAHGAGQSLNSVGRLHAAMSCTAFLWKPAGASPESKALALTNGHCVMPYSDRATTYDAWVNRPVESGWSLILNYFVDTPEAHRTITIQSIIYASMKATDLAILELNASWAELERDGLKPLPQAQASAVADSSIRVVGAPQGRIPRAEQFLREARCVEETRASVVEWFWTWFDAHRNSCADIHQGSSGSPVLNAQGEVYAVLNTTSAGAISESCYLGNPCEMQETGAFLVANKNYALNVVDLPKCFQNQTLSFGPDCPLPSPDTLAYRKAPVIPTGPLDRQGRPLRWAVEAQDALWKMGPVGAIDCRDEAGYRSDALPTDELPKVHGVYLLCLQKKAADKRFPTVVVLSLDTQKPEMKPELSLVYTSQGASFEPIFKVPELSFFWVGFGPQDQTICENVKLTVYRRVRLHIDQKDLPARICVQAEDHASNRGPIFSYEVMGGEQFSE